jgi:predicted homoserine dehydrogenase-like protein
MTVAKRDLVLGEQLGQLGGYTFYAVMDHAEEADQVSALPVGIVPGAKVVRPVAQGKIGTWDDVKLDQGSTAVKLRRMQDAMDGT